MTDQQIMVALRAVLLPLAQARLPAVGPITLKQNYQPSQQGANSAPTFYMHKIGPMHRHGWPGRRMVWDEEAEVLRLAQAQVYEARYQFNALIRQATDSDAATASDMLDALASILNGDAVVDQLRAQYGIGVLRITDLTNPYVVNDRQQFEAEPSFDVVLTFAREVIEETPATATIELGIYRV